MKKHLLASVACTALVAAPAMAADMPVKAPPPPVVFTWTGCYLGANAGYGWSRSDTATTLTSNFSAVAAQPIFNAIMSPTLHPKGGIAGGQIGCNYQAGNFVFGAETDYSYFHLTDSVVTSGTPPANATLTSTTAVSTDWLWTGRLRVGVAVDRALFYVTGGIATTRLNYSQVNSFTPCAFINTTISTEAVATSATKAGWTAGGGVEYAVTNNWTVKAEYLYADFGSISTVGADDTVRSPFFHNANLKVSTARVGINYLFK